jgi:hypothetical protein
VNTAYTNKVSKYFAAKLFQGRIKQETTTLLTLNAETRTLLLVKLPSSKK